MDNQPKHKLTPKVFLAFAFADAAAIASLFYFFAAVTKFEGASMPAKRFFLILLFSVLAEGAHLLIVPGISGIPKPLSRLLHFSVLLAAFLILSLSADFFSGSAQIFVAVILFAVLYALLTLFSSFLHKIANAK